MSNKCFCTKCGQKVSYSIKTEIIELTIRGVTFNYAEMSANCGNCNQSVYVPEINDANVESREEAYRKAMRLITVSEIQEILNKYDIGAGPLAKLLGFGDITINRYLSGQLPSRNHSEKLLKLKYDKSMMENLLEEGKDKITQVAYTKCKTAVDKLNALYSHSKIELIARYFLLKAEDITPLALQKLLYYAQAFYYALFKETLFADNCQAWVHGPVFPPVYYKYKECGYDPIEKPIEEYENEFSELTDREILLLDAIISSFGCYSGFVLRDMTHNEVPWIEARGNLHPEDRSTTTINRETINQYFDTVVKSNNILNPCDISKYSKSLYERISTCVC